MSVVRHARRSGYSVCQSYLRRLGCCGTCDVYFNPSAVQFSDLINVDEFDVINVDEVDVNDPVFK